MALAQTPRIGTSGGINISSFFEREPSKDKSTVGTFEREPSKDKSIAPIAAFNPLFDNAASAISRTVSDKSHDRFVNYGQCIPLDPSEAFARNRLARASCEFSNETPSQRDLRNKPKFDMLTLCQWFQEMDKDKSAHITRMQWLDFLRANPPLKQLMLTGSLQMPDRSKVSEESIRQGQAEARETRRLLKLWKEIDQDKNGTLEWEEFVDYFRQCGFLLEYKTQNNPRAKMAETLLQLHEHSESVPTAQRNEFMQLRGKHMSGERRRSLGEENLGPHDMATFCKMADITKRKEPIFDDDDKAFGA